MRRRLTPEHMDDPNIARQELDQSLRYIRAVNRRLGGVSALLEHLKKWSTRWPTNRPITLLDIATGSADLPIAARQWAADAGFDLRITAIDAHKTTVELAQEHVARAGAEHIEIIQADARSLMDHFEPASFDYVHAGLFLHHLPEIEILTVLRIMDRLARSGIVWNDLMRSRAGVFFTRVITARAPETVRHDARVSVEAGFTRREVLDFAQRLDLNYCDYRARILAHRFTLAGEKLSAWK